MELPGTPELGNAVPGCWIRMPHQMSKHRPSHSRFASGIASAQSPAARAALHWRRGGGDTGEELVTAVPSVQCHCCALSETQSFGGWSRRCPENNLQEAPGDSLMIVEQV